MMVHTARSGRHGVFSVRSPVRLRSLNPFAVRVHSTRAPRGLAALGPPRARDHWPLHLPNRRATGGDRSGARGSQWPPWGIALRTAGRPRPPSHPPAVR